MSERSRLEFYAKGVDGTVYPVKLLYDNEHAPGDAFSGYKLKNVAIVYDGNSMKPKDFEINVLGRVGGTWRTSIFVLKGESEKSIHFLDWFKQDVLGEADNSQAILRRTSLTEAVPALQTAGVAMKRKRTPFAAREAPVSPQPPPLLVRIRITGVNPSSEFFRYSGSSSSEREPEPLFVGVRLLGFKAPLPAVSFLTMQQFFHAHTNEAARCRLAPPALLCSDRFELLFEDPLKRGHVFSIDVAVASGRSQTMCFMYNGALAEFIKFSGFANTGKYVGLSKSTASSSPDRLQSLEAAQEYEAQAKKFSELFEVSWDLMSIRSEIIPPRRDHSTSVDDQWLEHKERYNPTLPFAPKLRSGPIKDATWRAFKSSSHDLITLREKFSLRSVEVALGRTATDREKLEIGDCMMWFLNKLSQTSCV